MYRVAINELFGSNLWIMGTIKHNTSLPATSPLTAVVTLLLNDT